MVLEDLFLLLLHFFTRSPIFLPANIRFYPFKWRVDGSLHKAMLVARLRCVVNELRQWLVDTEE